MPFTRTHPLVILLFNLLVPLSLMIPRHAAFHPFFLGIASLMLLTSGRWKRFLKFAAVYLIATGIARLLGLLPNAFSQLFHILLVATIQFTPCMMTASLLIMDYSAAELIASLTPFHLPKGFVVALSVVIRYIPTFRQEFATIKESMRIRRIPCTIRRPIQSFSYFLVPQLFRCAILADEITAAGLTKGITSPASRTSYQAMQMHWTDWVIGGLFLTGTAVILLWK